jgi:hypothetical protein
VHLRAVFDGAKQDLLKNGKPTRYAGLDTMNRKIIIVVCLIAILVVVLAYVILSSQTSSTVLSVEPKTVQETTGQNFTVNVSVSNVVDLYGWEFYLSWNSSLLDWVSVSEGSFLKSGGNTYFSHYLNTTDEHLVVDCTLYGQVPGVNGSGTLATIQFQVRESGTCDLNLYDTQLLDSTSRAISHTVQNGHFNA